MSSIIDALKKSDKNRSAESGKNINQIKFGNEPAQKNRRGFWLLVALLLLVVTAVFAWQQNWHHKALYYVNSWLTTDQTSESAASAADTSNQANNKMASEPATKNNQLMPPKPKDVKDKSIANKQLTDSKQSENPNSRDQQLEVIADRSAQAGGTKNDATDTLTIVEKESQPTTLSNSKEPDNVTDLASKTIEEKDAEARQNRKDLRPQLNQDYLLVHQIDFEIRKNIPPIKLNIHIYDPDPENRMVILNGVRYAAGESIEDLVMVEEINQEGVVLRFEDIKFLIPK